MPLESYEGHPVEACSVAITKAGDGLSSELEVAPVLLPYGSEVFYVLHGQVDKVAYDELPKSMRKGSLVLADEDAMVRMHTIKTLAITQVSKADVVAFLEEAARRVKRAEEDRSGILRLATDPEDTVAMQQAHDGGLHPDNVDGCPSCDPDSAAKPKRSRRKAAGG